MGVNITEMLTANIINFGMFAVITTLIFIFANLASTPVKYVLIPLVFVGSYIFLAWYTDVVKKHDSTTTTSTMYSTIPQDNEGTCSICSASKDTGEDAKLLPIMDPKFNLREVAKHLILLEDHLFHKGKRCGDCILKHLYTIDGFLDEGITLDKEKKYIDTTVKTQNNFKQVSKELEKLIKSKSLTDNMCIDLAQQLRNIRKPLVYLTADMNLNY